jgi:AcrR family transcriptional regulator
MPAVATVRPRRPKPRSAASARSTLTPERWIEEATEVLVDRGIDSVRVDVLAQQLQVTRGSFYWHFRDREDLLRRVLQAWRDQATVHLTLRLERAHADPREQLRDIISLPNRGRSAQRAARIELAIRPGRGATRWHARRWMIPTARASPTSRRCSALCSAWLGALAPLPPTYVVAESQIAAPTAHLQREERDRFIERLMLLTV